MLLRNSANVLRNELERRWVFDKRNTMDLSRVLAYVAKNFERKRDVRGSVYAWNPEASDP